MALASERPCCISDLQADVARFDAALGALPNAAHKS
jgi:hypothetical protein